VVASCPHRKILVKEVVFWQTMKLTTTAAFLFRTIMNKTAAITINEQLMYGYRLIID